MTQALNLALLANSVDASGDLSLTTGVTGTLPVVNGGTGRATLALNNILVGNGTTAVQEIAPGTAGQALISDGTTWAAGTPSASVDVQTFNSTAPWTKPLAGQTMARIQVWGGGGGAARATSATENYGGAGGGYNEKIVPLSTLAGTITATVGGGGAGRTGSTGAGSVGGNSTFDTVNAYGGAGATTTSGASAAGGGGQISAGSAGNFGRPRTTGSDFNGANGFSWHGGWGANNFSSTSIDNRADALFGGAGGAMGSVAGSEGQSVYGGNGGARNTAGVQPGGGGGGNSVANGNGSNGAAGRIIITSW